MSYTTIQKAPLGVWTALLAMLPACAGCGAVLCAVDGFCAECMERSRESAGDELGGES